VLVISVQAGCDTGACGYTWSRAFLRHSQPGTVYRSAVSRQNYLKIPNDLPWPEAKRLGPAVDVAQFRNSPRTGDLLGWRGKPFILTHHGTHFRENTDELNAVVAGAPLGAAAIATTLDLLALGPDITWVPQARNIGHLARLRTKLARPHAGPIRVAHAPTDRGIKSTEAFLTACRKTRVQPVLIERRTWAECVKVKATCDALYDQVILGYGNNAIEAWGLGLPVICGAAPTTLATMRAQFGGELPFVEATVDTIGDALTLLKDDAARTKWGDRGHAHARRWHDGTESAQRITAVARRLHDNRP
jgi:hypothetical protein